MAANEILPFAQDPLANVLLQAAYQAHAQRVAGNQPGVASAQLVNKALLQATVMAAGLGEFIKDWQANDVTDARTMAQLSADLKAALLAAMGDGQASALTGAGYKMVADANSPTGFLLFQWGTIPGTTGADITVNYPITFPTAVLHLSVTGDYTPASGSQAYHSAAMTGAGTSTSAFISRSSGAIASRFLAIGY